MHSQANTAIVGIGHCHKHLNAGKTHIDCINFMMYDYYEGVDAYENNVEYLGTNS